VKKFVFPENKSVNDFRVMGGIRGDDAIEPGAPPTCFCAAGAPDAAAGAATGIFADTDDADATATDDLRRLRFFFELGIRILIIREIKTGHERHFSVYAFLDAHPS